MRCVPIAASILRIFKPARAGFLLFVKENEKNKEV